MASPASIPTHLNTLPKRTPKLTYRTKSDNASINTSTTVSTQPSSSASTELYLSPSCSRSDTYSQLEGRRPTSAVLPLSPRFMDKNPKKKSSFLSGLFSVKEPSAQALLEYQKQLLKPEDQGYKSRTPAVGLGVSSAKLPPTVPKVNSKWNGIPQTAKEKEKKKQLATRQSMSHLTPSIRTEHSGGSVGSLRTSARPLSRGTLGGTSVHSSGSGNNLADLYGWEVTDFSSRRSSRDWTLEHRRPSTAQSRTSKTADASQNAFLNGVPEPPKIPQTYLTESPAQSKSSPVPPDHSHSPSLTPYNSSPVTPNSPSPIKTLASSKSNDGVFDDMKMTTIDAPAAIDDVRIKSAGVGILAPPASARKRPKNTTPQLNAERPKTSGTHFGPNNVHEPSTSETEPSPRSLLPPRSSSNRLRRSNSARDRLSLGMSLKHQAVAPWGWSEVHPETQAVTNDPNSISPTPTEGSKRKRLTIFK